MVSSVPDDNFQMDFGAKQCSFLFFGGGGGGYWCVCFFARRATKILGCF